MAELLLKVQSVAADETTYQDGDILCAFHTHHIECVHAQHYCFPRVAGRKPTDANGFRLDPDNLAKTYLDETYEFRFERVSQTEVKRIRLSDMSEDILSQTPNAAGEYVDVAAYVARRLAHAKANTTGKVILGSPGAEIWYGGQETITPASLTTIWNAIETATPNQRAAHGRWPLTGTEKRHFLGLAVNNFDDTERALLVGRHVREFTHNITITAVETAAGPHRYRLTLAGDYRDLRPRLRIDDIVLDGSNRVNKRRRSRIVDLRPQFVIVRAQFPPTTDTDQPATVSGERNLRKRRRRVDWRALSLSVTQAQVDDPAVEVDVREDGDFDRATVVEEKAPINDEDIP